MDVHWTSNGGRKVPFISHCVAGDVTNFGHWDGEGFRWETTAHAHLDPTISELFIEHPGNLLMQTQIWVGVEEPTFPEPSQTRLPFRCQRKGEHCVGRRQCCHQGGGRQSTRAWRKS